ncbi:MAG TPA: alpha/beta hydrolase [Thermoanaerobaculia bacterium]|nr:alpha/beta hydrolase [Thermoanaerobaculia bacterium]
MSFTLIHGSTQNAHAWQRVADRLRAQGHVVEAPDLPKNEPTWDLCRYAGFIAERIPAERPRVVVAHSFCGVFLPLIAEHADVLVFDAAIVPEPGRSVREQLVGDPSMFTREWIAAGLRWVDPREHEALAREFLFHDCDADTLRWALTTLELFHIQQLVGERCPLQAWPDVECHSIVPTRDRTVTPEWQRRMARHAIEIDAGHAPHVSRPEEVSAILHQLSIVKNT